MRKPTLIILVLSLFLRCGRGQERVRRIVTDGVDTVLNGIDPYVLKDEPGRLRLEKMFSIDTEDENQLRAGLTDIETFDVDGAGNIYLIQWNTKGNYIYKYDKDGKLLTSFCRNGQGPGEIEWGGTVMAGASGELIAKDPSQPKFLVYAMTGDFCERRACLVSWESIESSTTDRILSRGRTTTTSSRTRRSRGPSDPGFDRLNEVGTHDFPNRMTARNHRRAGHLHLGRVQGRLFVGNSSWGYEIRVLAGTGRLVRKIRKEYRPVPIDEEFRKAYLARVLHGRPGKEKYRFADHWPPFRYLFADDEGRLYVMTRETGAHSGEFQYDIFNAQGAFVGRMSLGNSDLYYPNTARRERPDVFPQ